MTTPRMHPEDIRALIPRPTTWTRQGLEIHDRPTHFDEHGSRTGETPMLLARVFGTGRPGEAEAVCDLMTQAPTLKAQREALADMLERILQLDPDGPESRWESTMADARALLNTIPREP